MSVIGHHVLDLFKLFPANVALVSVANQRPPLRTGLAPSPATGLSLLILYRMLGSAVRIRACVGWLGQHGVDGWCTEAVAPSLGRAGRKREPKVPVPHTP